MRWINTSWRLLLLLMLYGARSAESETSCTRLDFDQAQLSSLKSCEYVQEFVAKRYDASEHFEPYRPEAEHFLTYRWQGLSCGETVNSYSLNEETELRMAYNLIIDSGAALEVRVLDTERLDDAGQPTMVDKWNTALSTDGWGFFREKLNKTISKAKIQIEANINAGSDLAIEYLTIFNYGIATNECEAVDEFTTSTTIVTTTTEATTTSSTPLTTSSVMTTTTTEETTVPVTTTPTTTEEITTPTTSETTTTTTTTTTTEEPTTSSTSTSTTESTTSVTTTTTNGPRDDLTSDSTPSTTTAAAVVSSDKPQANSTTIAATTTGATISSTTISVTESARPGDEDQLESNEWFWMTLAAVFGVMQLFSVIIMVYLCLENYHLDRLTHRWLEADQLPQKQ
ncbi:protein let-653-like [Anopheles aquasalis]|uniref:protein let-653-like n=1 Tax=Anopheles aquasalis TaxID=42839 RepID=UPI00215B2C78|nr:protein let-653-like [Anopheles aquasalis]